MGKGAFPVVRAAAPLDVDAIHKLLEPYAEMRLVLPRSKADVLEHIGNFLVAELEDGIVGCVALRAFGGGLFEIRSLAVADAWTGRGLGGGLVVAAVDKGREADAKSRIFALTNRPGLFARLGFEVVNKEIFPEKIWHDCGKCPKLHHCDETALLLPPGKTVQF